MKNIIRSLVVVFAVAAIAGSATYALYHAEGTVSGVTASASDMDLKIDSNPDPSGYNWSDGFAVTNAQLEALGLDSLKPGSHGQQIFDIKNVAGDVDGAASIKLHRTSAWSDLVNNLRFTVYFDPDNNGAFGSALVSGTLGEFEGNTYTLGQIVGTATQENTGGVLGKNASVKIEWDIPSTAGNEIMGDSVTFDITFGLDQTP
ncbi:MAG: hypothetical protein Q8L09_03565 [Candidatus Moranbacteria bacterium]|nr:hypothetical protein [Candidatus Moranbacteria bacterium]